MSEVAGAPGELIQRLLAAVLHLKASDCYELTRLLVSAIGYDQQSEFSFGTDVNSIVVSKDEELPRADKNQIRRGLWEGIEDQLLKLTHFGLREDLLVRALRDELTRRLEAQVSTTHTNNRRKQIGTGLESWVGDPKNIAEFRIEVGKTSPEYLLLNDEEIAERILEMVNTLPPLQVEDELDALCRIDRWTTIANESISDTTIEQWYDQYSKRTHYDR
jgi:hypothetical protein